MKKLIIGIVLLVAVGIAVVILFYPQKRPTTSPTQEVATGALDASFFQVPTRHYGIVIDSLGVTKGKVKWNQNISEILSSYSIDYQDIHTLAERSKEVYDVRKLRAGADYSVIHALDSPAKAHHFVFEPGPTEYVVYHLSDSIYAEVGHKPVYVRERTIAAEISSSVYNAILDQDASPLLVQQMVDVFAWQVDFFRIAKGDKFKLIFDEESVDGKVVGIKNIKGAYFEHWGKEYYAIPFATQEKVDFFDEDGKSLRKTLLRAPLSYTRISSRYSLRRFHPVQKRYKAHLGTDYAAPTGTPIRTVGDGVVLEARYHGGNGNYVKVKHNSNYTTQYLHMSKIAKGVKPGVQVRQGQTIGYVGSTGLANGPHLCYRFWKNGKQVDALKVDLPSSEGIPADQLEAFQQMSDSVKAVLDQIVIETPKELLAEKPNPNEELTKN